MEERSCPRITIISPTLILNSVGETMDRAGPGRAGRDISVLDRNAVSLITRMKPKLRTVVEINQISQSRLTMLYLKNKKKYNNKNPSVQIQKRVWLQIWESQHMCV